MFKEILSNKLFLKIMYLFFLKENNKKIISMKKSFEEFKNKINNLNINEINLLTSYSDQELEYIMQTKKEEFDNKSIAKLTVNNNIRIINKYYKLTKDILNEFVKITFQTSNTKTKVIDYLKIFKEKIY